MNHDISVQTDLFGNPLPAPDIPVQRAVSRIESNDIDLMMTIADNAARCGYYVAGTTERIYATTDVALRNTWVVRVPRYEDDAVHQLLRRRWLTHGGLHPITCGAARMHGIAVLVPRSTRERIARWQRLQRPPSWPAHHHPPRADTTTADSTPDSGSDGRLVNLDDYRRTP